MRLNKKRPMGSIFVQLGILTEEELIKILNRHDDRETPIGDYLLKQKKITAEDLTRATAIQSEHKYLPPNQVVVDAEVVKFVPKEMALEFQALPIKMENDKLLLAVVDSTVLVKLNDLLQIPFDVAICSSQSYKAAFSSAYEKQENIQQILRKISDDSKTIGATLSPDKASMNQNTSVEKLINNFIQDAIHSKASDIHVEADDSVLRVRVRIDGILHERETFPLELHSAIISRLKLVANLDITEKRIPQDGRMQIPAGKTTIDCRVSTLPTIKGEKVVMRILDKENLNVNIDNIGMDNNLLKKTKQILRCSSGIILVTGPTGSGKTTTVYSMLNYINSMERNIITVEDPVEYHFNLINQVQINPKAGLTFPSSLRSILRQDPDVIMVGEIRDEETAQIAVKAALTGHLVISTIHTNDAVATVQRLVDIGIEPYIVSSALLGVVAQRLVRKICPHCGIEIKDPTKVNNYIEEDIIATVGKVIRATGCEHCHNVGYQGRMPVFEVFIPDNELKLAIKNGVSDIEMQKIAVEKHGFTTMLTDGKNKIKRALTTAEEVIKQLGYK
ncbi:MAG: hypothetical protein A2504_11555 [Bdellovibrionales bacterium RIFOXYD12_FULL_39_22]|nr:MAG: hypothetical protein A2385_16070 [Bdellovibrionales bacterium RIFOXYB1_FULL_39_21]OFZ44526.1 MAG: hypothetical protein A2485_06825 [Bdellovibrionales bacterium RIFOXYC12_FULL_39_17]OFZ49832.1 MAG: hypothetical protein A2404_00640 [Bdellovibrionales bacterium RIFOXYC1_FULL_39_130]OFZ71591.1 MAG: hypothetical protein A2451_01720 [Bdellovibrionales bacterium RIFOXYC2_FULL_39_8]OFZ76837.1 MAG: hypothetical protein A2560_05440 [Bdellovibrionales bacterium RIFOXYD1_FULL_39_84]OFZ95764.1 MAG: